MGSGSQQATHSHCYQLALEGGQAATYEAPVLPNSSVPALLGRKSLRDQRTLLDCFNNRMYRIGPGGYSLQLSPGSAQYHLEESHAGHLMLPCDLYDEMTASRSSGPTRAMTLTTSTAAETAAQQAASSPTPTSASVSTKRTTTSASSASGAAASSDSGQPGKGGLHL